MAPSPPKNTNRHRSDSDPLTRALAPTAGETPQQRQERLDQEAQAKKISDAIDEQLRKEKAEKSKKKREVKILLLGTYSIIIVNSFHTNNNLMHVLSYRTIRKWKEVSDRYFLLDSLSILVRIWQPLTVRFNEFWMGSALKKRRYFHTVPTRLHYNLWAKSRCYGQMQCYYLLSLKALDICHPASSVMPTFLRMVIPIFHMS